MSTTATSTPPIPELPQVTFGSTIRRTDIHAVLKGQEQSGISPMASTDYLMLFSNPPSASNPYTDGFFSDGLFHYTGEGQRGDQVMKRGNKALRDHRQNDKRVFLWEGDGTGQVRLIAELQLVDYKVVDGVGSDGQIRSEYRFRLDPITGGPDELPDIPVLPDPEPDATTVEPVPVEVFATETYDVLKEAATTENERRESKLVQEYLAFMTGKAKLVRHRIQIAGAVRPLYSDLFDPGRNLLIEAKGSTARPYIRTAIGQLLDYRRFLDPTPDMAILVPSEPADDVVALLGELGITVIFRLDSGGFSELQPGQHQ